MKNILVEKNVRFPLGQLFIFRFSFRKQIECIQTKMLCFSMLDIFLKQDKRKPTPEHNKYPLFLPKHIFRCTHCILYQARDSGHGT